MTLYRGKYRVETARLKGWDYGSPGCYFVTICTRDRLPFFGAVEETEVSLSPIGVIADEYWRAIPNHFAHVTLDAHIIMPNHLHGIIVIHERTETPAVEPSVVETPAVETPAVETPAVETPHVASLRGGNRFGPLNPGSLPVIIQSYKAAVSHWCRTNARDDFGWQARYYDHIVRDEASLRRIVQYIIDNPIRWPADRNHPDSVWL